MSRTMNRFDRLALAVAIVVTLIGARGVYFAVELYVELAHIGTNGLAVIILGCLIATYGPMLIAVAFWRWWKRVRQPWPWAFHLPFLPCAIAALRIGSDLMLGAIGVPDFDDTIGGPILPATLLFLAAVVGYLFALASRITEAAYRQSSESAE